MNIVDEADGVSCISLVEFPAIEKNYLKFSEEERKKLVLGREDKQIITGAAMIPDLPIYRCDETGYEYYVSFTKETIEKSAQRFFKNGNQANVSLQHEIPVDSVYVFESYIVDKERGIYPTDLELPDGSWVVSMKVEDRALWEEIKNAGLLNGFSIETLNTVQKLNKQEPAQESEPEKKDLVDQILDGTF
ncbi:MAG: hypothetical protein II305_03635 [Clostridia bacterium]|nr:hypothetical protein [Clostridia bacterium]